MLAIRDVARQSGVSAHTLRYYERAGLLPKPPRSAAGYRLYPEATVRRVRLLRVLRSLGFAVGELKTLAGVLEGRFPRGAVRARLEAKRDAVRARMSELERAAAILDALQACRCKGDCALVTRLIDERAPRSKPEATP